MANVSVTLAGVPETLLWTLYHRAVEARRPDTVLADPLAVELVERIDFPFRERFGDGERLAQWQALRARTFDGAVRRFRAARPAGTVVALGEGLETQFWRVDDGRVRWVSVDLPEVMAVREALLPEDARRRIVGCSALDPAWMEEIDNRAGVLLTAQGLLMYLRPEEVHRLIAMCAARFPGAALVFDAVPRWLVERSRGGQLRTSSGYRPPVWTWGFDRREEHRLRQLPNIAVLRQLRLPQGRGVVHGWLLPLVSATPGLRRLPLSVLLARFA
jgi:O-methyltransferase involved in polyketide biosynthesis